MHSHEQMDYCCCKSQMSSEISLWPCVETHDTSDRGGSTSDNSARTARTKDTSQTHMGSMKLKNNTIMYDNDLMPYPNMIFKHTI